MSYGRLELELGLGLVLTVAVSDLGNGNRKANINRREYPRIYNDIYHWVLKIVTENSTLRTLRYLLQSPRDVFIYDVGADGLFGWLRKVRVQNADKIRFRLLSEWCRWTDYATRQCPSFQKVCWRLSFCECRTLKYFSEAADVNYSTFDISQK